MTVPRRMEFMTIIFSDFFFRFHLGICIIQCKLIM